MISPTREAQVLAIVDLVAGRQCVTREEILGPRRYAHLAGPRHLAMYVARRVTGLSCQLLAEVFRRDHTVVLYGETQIRIRCHQEPVFAAVVENLVREARALVEDLRQGQREAVAR